MPYTVVIADDAVFMRKVIAKALESGNFVVVGEAATGVEAVAEYTRHRPDVIFLDITMAEKSGLEAAKDILAIDPNAAIIVCSAMGQRAFIEDALAAGVKNFVVKPFTPEKLVEAALGAIGK